MVPMEDFVTLTDENGNDVEFEFLDYVKYKNEEYVVLLPTEDCNGEVLIMKLTGGDVNDEEYEVVGDQKLLMLYLKHLRKNSVTNMYLKIN